MASLIAAGVCYLPRIEICIKSFLKPQMDGIYADKEDGIKNFPFFHLRESRPSAVKFFCIHGII